MPSGSCHSRTESIAGIRGAQMATPHLCELQTSNLKGDQRCSISYRHLVTENENSRVVVLNQKEIHKGSFAAAWDPGQEPHTGHRTERSQLTAVQDPEQHYPGGLDPRAVTVRGRI